MPSHTVIFTVHVCGNALYIGTQCLIQNDEEQAIFVCQNTYAYVLVITYLRGMLLVYGHDTRGRVAPEGGVSINRNIPIRYDL